MSKTAVLLFTRSAKEEALHKGYATDAGNGVRVARELLRRTETTLRASGLPIVSIDETRQRGADFGQKLAAAMSDAFALGYQSLLVVGNDAPGLLTRHLRYGAQQLAAGNNLIIPDRRGGIALLGISRREFAPAAFAGLPWETNRLFAELVGTLPDLSVLTAIADINTLADLKRAWRNLKARLSRLFDLVADIVPPVAVRVATGRDTSTTCYGRGPPNN